MNGDESVRKSHAWPIDAAAYEIILAPEAVSCTCRPYRLYGRPVYLGVCGSLCPTPTQGRGDVV